MDTVKYELKFFLDDTAGVEMEEFIPVFHDWIQTQQLAELLIDVADYRHVPHGPGVVLIAHDAHYAMDLADDRLGLFTAVGARHTPAGALSRVSRTVCDPSGTAL